MKKRLTTRLQMRRRRHARVRSSIQGTADRPRLNVSRSLRGMFLQLINDDEGKTLVSVNSKKDAAKGDAGERKGKIAASYLLGLALAEKAKALKIDSIVFDRGGQQYHGRIQAVAEGARDGGLTF